MRAFAERLDAGLAALTEEHDRMRSQPSRFADLSSLPRSAPSYARMLGRLERKPPPWNEAAMLRAANRRRFS